MVWRSETECLPRRSAEIHMQHCDTLGWRPVIAETIEEVRHVRTWEVDQLRFAIAVYRFRRMQLDTDQMLVMRWVAPLLV